MTRAKKNPDAAHAPNTLSVEVSSSVDSDDPSKIIVSAESPRASAFFSHLGDARGRPPGAPERLTPEDTLTVLPALELYFNACATLPEADSLVSYGLAVTAHSELSTSSCAFATTTLEPTDALQFFVSDLIEKLHSESWFIQMMRGVLAYVARDAGQGVCPTSRLAAYALAHRDAELLDVFVDFRTRAPFFRISAQHTPDAYEAMRLNAVQRSSGKDISRVNVSWSGLPERCRAAVLKFDIGEASCSAIDRAHSKVSSLRNTYSLPQPRRLPARQVNFLYEILGLSCRETVTGGGLGQPLVISTPSYGSYGAARKSQVRSA